MEGVETVKNETKFEKGDGVIIARTEVVEEFSWDAFMVSYENLKNSITAGEKSLENLKKAKERWDEALPFAEELKKGAQKEIDDFVKNVKERSE